MLRAALDLTGTAWMAARRAPGSGPSLRRIALAAFFALVLMAIAGSLTQLRPKIAVAIFLLIFALAVFWLWLLTPEDRRIIQKRLPTRFK
ncbi:MAG: hypothetical protein M5U15_10345 [Kiritimatiellae bacterium]|nr:hypothetical protein [Kiritimatiellia bacterium]